MGISGIGPSQEAMDQDGGSKPESSTRCIGIPWGTSPAYVGYDITSKNGGFRQEQLKVYGI